MRNCRLKQETGGFFEINAAIKIKITNIKQVVDLHVINRNLYELQNGFNLNNKFSLVNDTLLADSSLDTVDFSTINELYNKSVSNMLSEYETTHKVDLKKADTDITAQASDNTMLLIVAACIAAYVLLNKPK